MSHPLRIALFAGQFPVVSETFILRQLTGLLDLGHAVDLYAETRGDPADAVQPELSTHRLLERTTYMDMPAECAPWELPAWPLAGETWVPGAAEAIPNWRRVADALPALRRCLERAPALTEQALSAAHYGARALSLSALYRLDRLSALPGRYDVLHAHFGPVGESFRFARELWRAPLVVSFHGYDFTRLPRQQGADMYARLFAAADAITVNSEFTRARLLRLGAPAEKLHRLPMGVDLDAFPFAVRARRPGEPVRLLTVARLVEIKGHEVALRAVARLRARRLDVRYEVVGDGPLRRRCERLVEELGLGDIVVLHGARDGPFIRERMAAAHVGLLASVAVEGDAEGQGLFLQEAQACGLPVVATLHGGLPEGLVPGESGFLVAEGDVEALAERLEHLVLHPDCWAAMGRQGRAFVARHYDIHRLNRQLVDLYQAVRTRFVAPTE
ncbi:MAG: glycosyltransferase [Verrucomicrobia bacterium]|nr:glycosyltransferase [Verrucomicrobiota bacterium]